jgi:hypothetical protein
MLNLFLLLGLGAYLLAYSFEGPLRYLLNNMGLDSLIFVRDVLLLLPVLFIGVGQFLQRKLHPAWHVYLAIVVLHGLVLMLHIRSPEAVVYGAKMLLSMLVGAVVAPLLLKPSRKMLIFIGMLWLSVAVGVFLDKYVVSFPWVGLTTQIGDVRVDISRDWDMEGAAKRAGGFLRSSIHAASAAPLFGLLLMFHLTSWPLKILIALGTIFTIHLTTQKGSFIAFAVIMALLACWPKRPIQLFKGGYLFFLILGIVLALLLPGYFLDAGRVAGFSTFSFGLRIEDMWPRAWDWIQTRGTFPFGVGLGGISGAQLIYAPQEFNAADNMFIFMYASFGLFGVFYMLAVTLGVLRTPKNGGPSDQHALAILLFVACYGVVLSMLEDQMISLFLGAAISWVLYDARRQVNKTLSSSTAVTNA